MLKFAQPPNSKLLKRYFKSISVTNLFQPIQILKMKKVKVQNPESLKSKFKHLKGRFQNKTKHKHTFTPQFTKGAWGSLQVTLWKNSLTKKTLDIEIWKLLVIAFRNYNLPWSTNAPWESRNTNRVEIWKTVNKLGQMNNFDLGENFTWLGREGLRKDTSRKVLWIIYVILWKYICAKLNIWVVPESIWKM